MDLIVSAERFPDSGETVLGTSFQTAPGGKGANQAVQAARLGAEVTMVGKVGNDDFGQSLIRSCAASGVCTDFIAVDTDSFTAVGNIQLEVGERETKNRILVVPGANMAITSKDVEFLKGAVDRYDMVVLQLEIPMEINELVAEYAFDKGIPVMLNPAPSAPLSDRLLSRLSYISPNEHEAADLTGVSIKKRGKTVFEEDVKKTADVLLEKGVKHAIITLGSAGACLADSREFILAPGVDAPEVKDPTAAGDSFIGAFCTGVCLGLSHSQALDLANFTAALTVSRMGAQPSLPNIAEVTDFMEHHSYSGFDLSLLDILK
jgi:ribokinase